MRKPTSVRLPADVMRMVEHRREELAAADPDSEPNTTTAMCDLIRTGFRALNGEIDAKPLERLRQQRQERREAFAKRRAQFEAAEALAAKSVR